MNSSPVNSELSPHILVLGMGGTIAGLAPSPELNPLAYEAGQVEVGELLTKIEQMLPDGLNIISRQIANINSSNLSEPLLTELGQQVKNALANSALIGIVITHGTDTIEEAGLFLQATCGKYAEKLGKRVVLTGRCCHQMRLVQMAPKICSTRFNGQALQLIIVQGVYLQFLQAKSAWRAI